MNKEKLTHHINNARQMLIEVEVNLKKAAKLCITDRELDIIENCVVRAGQLCYDCEDELIKYRNEKNIHSKLLDDMNGHLQFAVDNGILTKKEAGFEDEKDL